MSLDNVTYGFYASVNHDRQYDNSDFSKVFSAIINDGVFANIGEKFAVSPSSGMTVRVGTGRAWFSDTWTALESAGYMTLASSHNSLARIDAIVITVNKSTRVNSIDIVQGTNASNPSNPSLNSNQHPLAFIKVNPGVTAITASDITQAVPATTGYVTGPMEVADLSYLYSQWNAQFNVWFTGVQQALSSTDAATLQGEIDTINASYVPKTREINGKALSRDVDLTAADIGAVSASTNIYNNIFKTITFSDNVVQLDAFEFISRSESLLDNVPSGYTPVAISGVYTSKAACSLTTHRIKKSGGQYWIEVGYKNTSNASISNASVTIYILCLRTSL